MSFEILTNDKWDLYLNQTSYPSVYLSSQWFQLVENQFGGEKKLVLWVDSSGEKILIPYFQGRPWSDQVRIGSIGYGGPIPLNSEIKLSVDYIQSITKSIFNKECTAITSLPGQSINNTDGEISTTYTNIMRLNKDSDFYNETYSGNIRTAIRKAEKSGVKIVEVTDDILEEAVQLIHFTQKAVGAPYVTPYFFIKEIIQNTMVSGNAFGAVYEGKLISVVVFVHNDFELGYYLNGWNRDYKNLCANQLLIHNMIITAINRGCSAFNFGESAYGSLQKSKLRWGGDEYFVNRWRLSEQDN